MKRNFYLLFVMAVISLVSAQGAVLFSDDFESYTAGNQVVASAPWAAVNATTTSASRFVRDENTATPFGSPNQYLELSDTGTGTADGIRLQSGDYTQASAAVTTFQFDFYELSSGGAGNLAFGFATTGADINSGGNRIRVTLDDGTIGGLNSVGTNTYSLNTAYTLYAILNDTASAFNYDGGSVAAGSADIWLKQSGGNAVLAGSVLVNNSQTTSYSVGFRSFSGDLQDVLVDNVSFYEGAAAVPEPSVVLLGGLGMLLLLFYRRV